MSSSELWEREARLHRAIQTVLEEYELQVLDEYTTRLTGGSAPWEVTVDPTWADGPECTCPDPEGDWNQGYCKHIIAVLLSRDDVRCQLLEILI